MCLEYQLLKNVWLMGILMHVLLLSNKGCKWEVLAANWRERCSHHKDRNIHPWERERDSASEKCSRQVSFWPARPGHFNPGANLAAGPISLHLLLLFSAGEAHSALEKVCEELKQKLNATEADQQSQSLMMTAEIDDLNRTKVILGERLIELIRYDLSLLQLSAASRRDVSFDLKFLFLFDVSHRVTFWLLASLWWSHRGECVLNCFFLVRADLWCCCTWHWWSGGKASMSSERGRESRWCWEAHMTG